MPSPTSAHSSALSLRLELRPHRDSGLRPEQAVAPLSQIFLQFGASGQELLDGCLAKNWSPHIPIPRAWQEKPQEIAQNIFAMQDITFSAKYRAHRDQGICWEQIGYPSHNLFADDSNEDQAIRVLVSDAHVNGINRVTGRHDNVGIQMAALLREKPYLFEAQRRPQSICNHGANPNLASDAANLAEVLNLLQESPTAYKGFIDQVRRVVPLIKWVSVGPVAPGKVEIRVWNVEENSERMDLAVPLIEAGTGIGQVLAIL